MNRLLARSVIRGCLIINGRNFTGGNMLQSPEMTTAVISNLRPFDQTVMARDQDLVDFKWRRMMSSATEAASKTSTVKQGEAASEKKEGSAEVVLSSYWGISRSKITREDGTEWPWNCFMPWETYQSDLSIDLSKHHVPKNFIDKFAYRTVKLLRIPTDIFFQGLVTCKPL